MPHAPARNQQRGVAVPALLVAGVGIANAGLVEAQDLVVVGMRQLVHDAPRLHVDLPRGQELGRHGNMDAMHEIAGIAVLLQPLGIGMILHGKQLSVRHIQHDRDGMEFFQAVRADHGVDIGEFRLQGFQHADPERLMGRPQQPVVDADVPAFDFANRVRSGFRRVRLVSGRQDSGGQQQQGKSREGGLSERHRRSPSGLM